MKLRDFALITFSLALAGCVETGAVETAPTPIETRNAQCLNARQVLSTPSSSIQEKAIAQSTIERLGCQFAPEGQVATMG